MTEDQSRWSRLFILTSATLRLLLLVFATSLVAQETASEFPQLLDALERAATPMERGFDQGIRAFNRTGNRVIQLLGAPENWDAYGTQELRAAVIERWRRRWKEEGPAMLQGLQKVGTVPGEVEVNAADIRFSKKIRDMIVSVSISTAALRPGTPVKMKMPFAPRILMTSKASREAPVAS